MFANINCIHSIENIWMNQMSKSSANFKDISNKDKVLKIIKPYLRCLYILIEKAWNMRKLTVHVTQSQMNKIDSYFK